MSDTKQPTPPTSGQILMSTLSEATATHKDTQQILDLLQPPEQEGGEDRIDQLLGSLADVLTSLAGLHEKVDRLSAKQRT